MLYDTADVSKKTLVADATKITYKTELVKGAVADSLPYYHWSSIPLPTAPGKKS